MDQINLNDILLKAKDGRIEQLEGIALQRTIESEMAKAKIDGLERQVVQSKVEAELAKANASSLRTSMMSENRRLATEVALLRLMNSVSGRDSTARTKSLEEEVQNLKSQLDDIKKKLGSTESTNQIENKDPEVQQVAKNHLICSICQEIFMKPSLIDCGHTFCHHCIRSWKREAILNSSAIGEERAVAKCPLCRTKIDTITENKPLENLIQDFFAKQVLTSEELVARDAEIAERLAGPRRPQAQQNATPNRPPPRFEWYSEQITRRRTRFPFQ